MLLPIRTIGKCLLLGRERVFTGGCRAYWFIGLDFLADSAVEERILNHGLKAQLLHFIYTGTSTLYVHRTHFVLHVGMAQKIL